MTGDGKVVQLSAVAEQIFRDDNGVRLEYDYLLLDSPKEQTRWMELVCSAALSPLRHALEDPVAATQSRGSAASALQGRTAPAGSMQISRKPPAKPLIVTVMPYVSAGIDTESQICAIAVFSDPDQMPVSRERIARDVYGLTQAESQFVSFLLKGAEISAAAEQLSITLQSARFRLKRILKKTGTHRQADLVRLLLTVPGEREQ